MISLVVTYHPEERTKRTFEVLVDGQRIGNETIERNRRVAQSDNSLTLNTRFPQSC